MMYQNHPYIGGAESACSGIKIASLATNLMEYDVIALDIFDTLILRSLSSKDSFFYILEKNLKYSGLANLRKNTEAEMKNETADCSVVTIERIWDKLAVETGISSQDGIRAELNCISALYVLNPYMKHVYRAARARGKKIILVSDSIIGEKYMGQLLGEFGIKSYDKLYLSCDYGYDKSSGLWQIIKQDYAELRIVSVGDNRERDVNIPRQIGIEGRYYPDVHSLGNKYRAEGMSTIVGSAYAGLVNIKLHHGLNVYSPWYEYGYVYGGVYIFGFCHWLHRKAKKDGIEKILFLSRDGAVYQKAFRMLFSDIDNEYFLWSRIANIKYALTLYNREDCLTRILRHRAHNPLKVTMESILKSMQIKCLIPYLKDYGFHLDSLLIPENLKQAEDMFIEHWQEIADSFVEERAILKEYILKKIGNAKKIAFVDVGWAGSGARGLKRLINEYMGLEIEVNCWQAAHNPRIQGGSGIDALNNTVEYYIFSDNKNREWFDFHIKNNKGFNNMFFELFTQDLTPSYAGIDREGEFHFDVADIENHNKVKEFHHGILDFCREYSDRYASFSFFYNISGYDAYAPYAFVMQDLEYGKKNFSEMSFSRSLSGSTQKQKIESLDMIMRQAKVV